MPAILEIANVHVSYGAIRALRGVSLRVGPHETVAVIGANGAGKTTLMRAVSKLLPLDSGSIYFDGADVAAKRPNVLARSGLLHIPEGRGTLQQLSVIENLRIAFDRQRGNDAFDAALERVFERFPRLKERFRQTAGTLSGGEQQMLALARAIVRRPRLLLLDEPSLGLSPRMVKEAFAALAEFKREGIPIMLVEQNARAALAFAETGYVMRQGEIIFSGKARDLLAEPAMLQHYLGE